VLIGDVRPRRERGLARPLTVRFARSDEQPRIGANCVVMSWEIRGDGRSALCGAGRFIDSAAPNVVAFARETVRSARDDRERIILLYNRIRDGILYDPYVDFFDPTNYRASSVLALVADFASARRHWSVPARGW
jgi:transglutaminase-like putative cysteine protease